MGVVLTAAEADAALAARGLNWTREGDELVHVHRGRDFVSSLDFVNAVGELAQAADHHPDIDIRWNVVTLRLTTHSDHGLTAKDLELAARIDALQVSG